jgi:hypothetical protein
VDGERTPIDLAPLPIELDIGSGGPPAPQLGDGWIGVDQYVANCDVNVIFGNQGHAGEFHKTGFNESILRNYVEEALFEVKGFERMQTHGQMTMSIECSKQEPLAALYREAVRRPSDINEHVELLCSLGSMCNHITEICGRTLESTIAFLHARPAEFVAYNTDSQLLPGPIKAAVDDTATRFSFNQADSLAMDIASTTRLRLSRNS